MITTAERRNNFWWLMRNRYYERAGEAKDAKERTTWLARAARAELEATL